MIFEFPSRTIIKCGIGKYVTTMISISISISRRSVKNDYSTKMLRARETFLLINAKGYDLRAVICPQLPREFCVKRVNN